MFNLISPEFTYFVSSIDKNGIVSKTRMGPFKIPMDAVLWATDESKLRREDYVLIRIDPFDNSEKEMYVFSNGISYTMDQK